MTTMKKHSRKQKDQTLFCKIVILNTLINSLFTHYLSALPSPPSMFYQKYKRMVLNYLWGDKPVRIRYERLVQDYNNLGLKLIDLHTKELVMKAAWPCRWAKKERDQITWVFEKLPIKDKCLCTAISPQRTLKDIFMTLILLL